MESVLTTEGQWANLAEQVDPWPTHVPVYLAERPIFDAVAGFPIHRGCVALARAPAVSSPELWSKGPGWWLGLHSISDHDNVGSLLRTAMALGARGALHDTACADPLYRRAVRVSMGAAFLIPRAVASWSAHFDACRHHSIKVAALTPHGDTELQWGADPFKGDRWALWLGAEGPGLPAQLIAEADLRLRIPMASGADSFNVAVAAALAAWAYRGRTPSFVDV